MVKLPMPVYFPVFAVLVPAPFLIFRSEMLTFTTNGQSALVIPDAAVPALPVAAALAFPDAALPPSIAAFTSFRNPSIV
jgi:hypothetical protein